MHSWRQRLEDRKRGQQMQRHFRLETEKGILNFGIFMRWVGYELKKSSKIKCQIYGWARSVLGGSWKEYREDLKISLAGFWKRVFKTRQHHRAFVVDKYWKMLMPPARCYLPQHSKLLSQCHSQEDHVIPISTGKTEGGNSDSVKMLICKPNSRI